MSKVYDPSTYVHDIFLQDILETRTHIIILYDQQKQSSEGTLLLGECPVCHKQHWVRKIYIESGHTKSTYCFEHKNFWQIQWATTGEFNNKPHVIVDYTQQKASESAVASQRRVVFILGTCPGCTTQRFVRVHGIRNGTNTTYCMSCAKKNTLFHNSKPKKPWVLYNGYKYIHKDVLAKTYSLEELRAITTHIRASKECYYPEHRVVALLKYGPLFFTDGQRLLYGISMAIRPIIVQKTSS